MKPKDYNAGAIVTSASKGINFIERNKLLLRQNQLKKVASKNNLSAKLGNSGGFNLGISDALKGILSYSTSKLGNLFANKPCEKENQIQAFGTAVQVAAPMTDSGSKLFDNALK